MGYSRTPLKLLHLLWLLCCLLHCTVVNFLVWLDLYLTSFCQSSTICLLVSNLPFLSKLFKSSRSLSGIQLCGPQHPTLIQCLETLFGLKDLELAWLCIFLTYRTQSVCIDNIMSNPCQVFSSLPQGSVCGHLLFMSYVADIVNFMESFDLESHFYMDEGQIYSYLSSNTARLRIKVVDCISNIKSWMTCNDLVLYPM